MTDDQASRNGLVEQAIAFLGRRKVLQADRLLSLLGVRFRLAAEAFCGLQAHTIDGKAPALVAPSGANGNGTGQALQMANSRVRILPHAPILASQNVLQQLEEPGSFNRLVQAGRVSSLPVAFGASAVSHGK